MELQLTHMQYSIDGWSGGSGKERSGKERREWFLFPFSGCGVVVPCKG